MCRLPFSIGIMKIEIRSCWTIQLQSLPLDHIDFFSSPLFTSFSHSPHSISSSWLKICFQMSMSFTRTVLTKSIFYSSLRTNRSDGPCVFNVDCHLVFSQHLLSFDNFCANEGATFVNLTKFDLCWQMAEWPLEAQLGFTPRGNDQHLSQVLLTWTYDSSS